MQKSKIELKTGSSYFTISKNIGEWKYEKNDFQSWLKYGENIY